MLLAAPSLRYIADYDNILVVLLGLGKNGSVQVTRFSVPTTYGTVIVI